MDVPLTMYSYIAARLHSFLGATEAYYECFKPYCSNLSTNRNDLCKIIRFSTVVVILIYTLVSRFLFFDFNNSYSATE